MLLVKEWMNGVDVRLDTLIASLRRWWPDLEPQQVIRLSQDPQCLLIRMPGGWVVKWARTRTARRRLAFESRQLARWQGIAGVPQVESLAEDLMRYRWVEGQPLSSKAHPDSWAPIIGEFLAAIHDPRYLPPELRVDRWRRIQARYARRLYRRGVEIVFDWLLPREMRMLDTISAPYLEGADERPLAVLHGHFEPRTVLVENGHLSGVIGWGHLRVGDPLWDFVYWPPEWTERWIAPDTAENARLRWYRILLALYAILAAFDTGHLESTEKGVEHLQRLLNR